MPKATGPIGYIEHRSPQKDESGEYIVHPKFVQKEMYDMEDMAKDCREHYMISRSQLLSAESAMEDLTLRALGSGNAVRLGDMFIIRPKLRVLHHKDKVGGVYKKTYHEGERIPSNEVEVCGFDIQPTKEFREEFFLHHFHGCSRQEWSMKMPAASEDKESDYIIRMCQEHGYITVKDFVSYFGVSKYHARKVLDTYCEMPDSWLKAVKEGGMMLYVLRK